MTAFRSTAFALLGLASLVSAPALAQRVPVAPFDSVQLRGGGHVIIKYGEPQQVRIVSGSPAVTRFSTDEPRKLVIDACSDTCPLHYDLQVEITTQRIVGLGVSGGGAIEVASGFPPPPRLALGVDGGGHVDTRALDARDVDAGVDGGGVIRLRATGKLVAAVNGGGRISYWGHPDVTRAISGGGDVEPGF